MSVCHVREVGDVSPEARKEESDKPYSTGSRKTVKYYQLFAHIHFSGPY